MTNRGSANRLLVIDDEPEACDFVKEIAERQGYMVVTTTHAQAFREAVQRFQPTVIYVDLHMPEVDGMDLLHFLAREKVEARILVFSGKDDRVLATARHIGRTQGVDVTGTFQKPIDPDTLDGTLQALSTPESRLTAADLAEAIVAGDLVAYYQPKLVRVSDQVWEIDAAEALVRWQHADYGLVMPNEFMPTADASGQITAITDYVLRTAVEQVSVWRKGGLDLKVTVNLSPQLVGDVEFPDRLVNLLREYDVPASNLILEITEGAALASPDRIIEILKKLKLRGIGLSLDDFGTGYSSLTQIYRMPFDELKIDRSLVQELDQSREAKTMVRAIVDLGHNLHMKVCAEGVESQSALDFLSFIGCDRAQGYLVSRAVPPAELEAAVRGWVPNQDTVTA